MISAVCIKLSAGVSLTSSKDSRFWATINEDPCISEISDLRSSFCATFEEFLSAREEASSFLALEGLFEVESSYDYLNKES